MRAISCFVPIMLACLFGSSVFAAPVLQMDASKFDFGEVFQGEKVRHVFKFVNEGDEALVIDRVRSSCGCTAVMVSEKNIPPGGKGELQANFDSGRFRGPVKKTIYIYNNDPTRPTKQLQISGTVLELVTVNPPQVNFGEVAAGETVTSSFTLHNQSGKTLTLGKPKATAAGLITKMPKAEFDQDGNVALEVQLTPKPGHTRFSAYVLVPIDGVPRNELRIPVSATVKQ